MAKKSLIRRETKRQKLVKVYSLKRNTLKKQLADPNVDTRTVFTLRQRLQQLPRNSNPTRLHRRCEQTGRPRGVFRDFGLSRHLIRELAHEGCLPGVTKASW
jgi:small subunit ribosomal protein S14